MFIFLSQYNPTGCLRIQQTNTFNWCRFKSVVLKGSDYCFKINPTLLHVLFLRRNCLVLTYHIFRIVSLYNSFIISQHQLELKKRKCFWKWLVSLFIIADENIVLNYEKEVFYSCNGYCIQPRRPCFVPSFSIRRVSVIISSGLPLARIDLESGYSVLSKLSAIT